MSELQLNSGFLDTKDQALQVFEEDPVLHDGRGKPAWTEVEFTDYFAERDFPGSPCEGYHALADTFVADLHQMLRHLEEVKVKNDTDGLDNRLLIPVALKPFNLLTQEKTDAAKLYDREETKASHAFRGQMEYMLRAQMLNSDAEWGTSQLAVYSANPYDLEMRNRVNMYLLEQRATDEQGEFTKLWLCSNITSSMMWQPAFLVEGDKRFFTTGETQKMVLDLYRDLGEWALQKAA